jgi:predicted DNA-binding transcriptional regulator AlpA
MKSSTRKMLKVLLESDDSITEQQHSKLMEILLERSEPLKELPLLLNQAQVARLLGVSRWTIRNMVKAGQFHPVNIRGCKRFRRDEIEGVAMGNTK